MRFSLVAGVGMNLSPLESKFICSFVSCSFEGFLICCLRDSMAQRNRFYLVTGVFGLCRKGSIFYFALTVAMVCQVK